MILDRKNAKETKRGKNSSRLTISSQRDRMGQRRVELLALQHRKERRTARGNSVRILSRRGVRMTRSASISKNMSKLRMRSRRVSAMGRSLRASLESTKTIETEHSLR